MKTIILYGLRRSGCHFLISYILQHFHNAIHINDCRNFSFSNYQNFKNVEITKDRSDIKFIGFKNTDCVVISMENIAIDKKELDKFKNIDDCHAVLLLRNPYNNLASSWRAYMSNANPKCRRSGLFNQTHSMWIDYADEYLKGSMTNVLYDSFVELEEYRNKIMTSLGISIKNVNLNKKIQWQCSSFSDNSNKQKIWGDLKDCNYGNDPEFVKLFENGKHKKLWNKVTKKTCESYESV